VTPLDAVCPHCGSGFVVDTIEWPWLADGRWWCSRACGEWADRMREGVSRTRLVPA
jgi:hypothetical protein